MKTWALVILAVGILLLLVSLGADVLGLGGSPEIFGYKQMAGAISGAVLALVGAFLYMRSPKA